MATHSDTVARIPHPFYQDAQGVNRPPGPEKHPNYTEFAATGSGVVPIVRTVNGKRIDALLICRYDDVRTVLRRQDVFSREAAAHADDVDVSGTVLGMDGERHARVRGVVRDAFAMAAVDGMRPGLERAAAERLAAMKAGGRRADLMDDFALPFTLDAVCDLLGLPLEDRMRFRSWSDMFLNTADISREEAARSAEEMGAYLWGQIDARRTSPSGDLLSRIAVDGADLPPDIQVKLALALVVGGWETAAGSICRFVHVLCTRPYGDHPTGWEYLLANPGEIDTAVTELERLYSTTAGDDMPRRVMADVELPSGARLREGDIVIPSHDAANRDPRAFGDPGRMDFGRTPNRHMSYGHGAHYCIGAPLGALEIRIAIAALLRELPALRPAVPPGEVRWKAGQSLTSPESLPIEW
ncbi:cytochrome P450 [Spirillospora sp. NPDC029432]|uniref:cytochrome P450 n=1 Tax=Spirillospora sp. NPDC029432 TaxID=3154599 RepID=UPI0034515674